MDFEKLFNQISKEPEKWNSEDVVTWLNFIGLDSLSENFSF